MLPVALSLPTTSSTCATISKSIHWNKQPPAPVLPEEIAAANKREVQGSLHSAHRKNTLNLLDILLVMIVALSVGDRIHRRDLRAFGIGFLANDRGAVVRNSGSTAIPAATVSQIREFRNAVQHFRVSADLPRA